MIHNYKPMQIKLVLKIVTVAIVLNAFSLNAKCEKNELLLWTTGNMVEPDRCAVVWIARKFSGKDVKVISIKEGEKYQSGIPFDMPFAFIARSQDKTSFDRAIEYFSVNDDTVAKMALIIRDIELNIWSEKKESQSNTISQLFLGINRGNSDFATRIEDGVTVIKALYYSIKSCDE